MSSKYDIYDELNSPSGSKFDIENLISENAMRNAILSREEEDAEAYLADGKKDKVYNREAVFSFDKDSYVTSMKLDAKDMAESGGFLDLTDSDLRSYETSLKSQFGKLSNDTLGKLSGVDITDADRKRESEKYSGMMEGFKRYRDEASKTIDEVYKNDPEKRRLSHEGLNKMSEVMTSVGFSSIYQDNKSFNMLSDKDRAFLDETKFFDNQKLNYSGYEHVCDVSDGRISNFDFVQGNSFDNQNTEDKQSGMFKDDNSVKSDGNNKSYNDNNNSYDSKNNNNKISFENLFVEEPSKNKEDEPLFEF